MPTGLERPGGTSSGLPPALLTSEIGQKPTSRAPGAAGLLLFDFACSHQGTTALLAVLVGAPESAPPGRSEHLRNRGERGGQRARDTVHQHPFTSTEVNGFGQRQIRRRRVPYPCRSLLQRNGPAP